MWTRLFLVCGILAGTAWASAPKPTKTVGGVKVVPGPAFVATELVVISNLRFFACTNEKTGEPCTVVTGTLESRIPTNDLSIEVEIAMYNVCERAQRYGPIGPFRATVNRPVKGSPTQFIMLGPPGVKQPGNMTPTLDGAPLTNAFSATYHIGPPKPTFPDGPVDKLDPDPK